MFEMATSVIGFFVKKNIYYVIGNWKLERENIEAAQYDGNSTAQFGSLQRFLSFLARAKTDGTILPA